jgi:hypothetical protein
MTIYRLKKEISKLISNGGQLKVITREMCGEVCFFFKLKFRLLARHRKRSVRIESFLPSTWNESKYNQIFPVYDEDRYVLFKSSTLMKNNEENYGLCLPNE